MKTRFFIAVITAASFGCLAIVSLNGIAQNMVACWPLAFVVSAGFIALALTHLPRLEK